MEVRPYPIEGVAWKRGTTDTPKKHKNVLSEILCDFKHCTLKARSCSLGMFSTKISTIMMQAAGHRGTPTDS